MIFKYKTSKAGLLLIIFSSLVHLLYAQQSYGDVNKRIIPQPPNVASLFKFNEVPVNYFNGTADVNIPLFDIKEGNVDLPLSLSYHTGGIKVAEEASWVGLGWNLNVGGVIQEIIVGEPDYEQHAFDMSLYNLAPKPNSPPGTPWTTSSDTYNITETGFCYQNASGQIQSYRTSLDPSFSNVATNPNFEYDLYSFNFNGHSGKFIFPDMQNGSCFDKQNIIFKKNSQNIYGYDPTATITATTPDGTKYFFEVVGVTSTQRICNTSTFYTLPIRSRTWYLSKIIYPNNQQIVFNYVKTTARTLPNVDENFTYTMYDASIFPLLASSNGGQYNAIQNYSIIDNCYLSNIQFNNHQINFITSPRQDLENALKLDAIQLYGTQPGLLKQINLNYAYFAGNANYGDWTSSPLWNNSMSCTGQFYVPPSNFADLKSKRLKLTQVQTVDANNNTIPPYTFSYNDVLPLKTSLAQDLWGYFNGASNNTLLPDYNNLGYWDENVPYQALSNVDFPYYGFALGNRSCNSNNQTGMLKQITYPTGGYSLLNYESNTALNTYNGIQTNIFNATADATDFSSGITQKVFTVPNVGNSGNYTDTWPNVASYGPVNPVTITVTLWCCQGAVTCPSQGTACGAYNVYPNQPTLGLYALLEYFDPVTNQWYLNPTYKFDISTTYFNNGNNPFGIVTLHANFPPGQYRITANFPDNAPIPGSITGSKAEIFVTYKDIQQTTPNPLITVGGLRVKNTLNYSQNGSIALQKHFTYSSGKLMNFPLFYRKYIPYGNLAQSLSVDCPDNHVYDDSHIANPWPPQINYTQSSLYSNPVMPYSYSAQGAVVGYDTVSISYDGTNSNGKTENIYNCIADHYNTYGALVMPGIPTAPYLQNGSLKKQTQFKKMASQYIPLTVSEYEYNYSTETKWCFKSEYHPSLVWLCAPDPPYIPCLITADLFRPTQLLLNFYPIKFGKLNTIQKKETTYDGSNQLSVTTNYDYNTIFQPRLVSTVNSLGKTKTEETYYPIDYTSNDITQEMRNRNMLDYPIEQINRTDGLATSGVYNSYSMHDGIVTPDVTFKVNTNKPVSLTPSIPNNTKDSRYLPEFATTYDAHGNIIMLQKTNDVKEVYIWSYNGAYPVARITGSDYATVNSLISQASIDAAANSNNDANLRNVLNPLRTALPDALVTTFTYKPLVGITSQTDPNNQTSYYEYDRFNRLILIRDKDNNILKKICYNYAGQAGDCTTP